MVRKRSTEENALREILSYLRTFQYCGCQRRMEWGREWRHRSTAAWLLLVSLDQELARLGCGISILFHSRVADRLWSSDGTPLYYSLSLSLSRSLILSLFTRFRSQCTTLFDFPAEDATDSSPVVNDDTGQPDLPPAVPGQFDELFLPLTSPLPTPYLPNFWLTILVQPLGLCYCSLSLSFSYFSPLLASSNSPTKLVLLYVTCTRPQLTFSDERVEREMSLDVSQDRTFFPEFHEYIYESTNLRLGILHRTILCQLLSGKFILSMILSRLYN